MKKSVLICGQAGQGINFTSVLLGRALRNAGYYVFVYRDYGSLIKGGHNFNVVTFADSPIYSHQNEFQAVIDLDGTSAEHRRSFSAKTIILSRKDISEKSLSSFHENNYLLGALAKNWDLPPETMLEAVKKEVKPFGEAIRAVRQGYRQAKVIESIPLIPARSRYFFSGTRGVALGAVSAGMDVYLSYPMTPATDLLVDLAGRAKKHKMMVLQLEDEVGMANAALGASFAGAKVMAGTAGGGFALMSEALALSGIAEIPLVVYLAQRAGPSTGVPTHTGQGDLGLARFAGPGEFPRVLVAPGDPAEAWTRTMEAFHLAYRYRLPAILLTDKHLSESFYTLDEIDLPSLKTERFIVDRPGRDYQSYAFTASGVSPRAVPGQPAVVRASSYEHDAKGLTTEQASSIKKINEKRWRREKALAQTVARWNPIKVWGRGRNLIVGWGSTAGAIRDALAELPDHRFMQISYISPFPKKEVVREMEKSDKIILVENNVTGLLGQIVAMETGRLIESRILKYDGRPFTAEEIVDEIKRKR